MRIARIRFAGFRGARGEVSLELPAGFVVVVGRNGTGKSTLCDAIEYALTDGIRGSSDHVEKGEGIGDYIWWRGNPTQAGRFVELVLVDNEQKHYVLRRTPTEFTVTDGFNPASALCLAAAGIERPLAQLCRTAILRDEEITRLSVDLRETDRFEFVRATLGTADFSAAEARAKEVQELVARELQRTDSAYVAASNRVTDITAKLSQARTEVAKASELAEAEARLRQFLGNSESQQHRDAFPNEVERQLSGLRLRTDRLTRLYTRFESFRKRRAEVQNPEHIQERARLSEQSQAKESEMALAEREAVAAAEELAAAQLENPRNASLALLREHGERVGLTNAACPLCGSMQTEEHFRSHLAALATAIASASEKLTLLAKRSAEASIRLDKVRAEAARITARHQSLKAQEAELTAEYDALTRDARQLNFELSANQPADVSRLASTIEANRVQVSQIERALSVLHASRAIDQVSALEQDLKSAREELAAVEHRLARTRAAANEAREATATIRRVQGEFVNEQLAQLEPLMVEIYQRLRPHVDWPEVRYRLRGDVRRMLSLEVGEGLNPSFVFSSGQRRAAGLAFLLALHLSRSWCGLETLVLDDPVQHIDDYRAIHLTEVLTAIRATGRQVLCTVEDDSLGRLLARRLRSEPGAGGILVRMAYSSKEGIHVESISPVRPMPQTILLPA